jgi:hypothetical protein
MADGSAIPSTPTYTDTAEAAMLANQDTSTDNLSLITGLSWEDMNEVERAAHQIGRGGDVTSIDPEVLAAANAYLVDAYGGTSADLFTDVREQALTRIGEQQGTESDTYLDAVAELAGANPYQTVMGTFNGEPYGFPPGTVDAYIDENGNLIGVNEAGDEYVVDSTYDTTNNPVMGTYDGQPYEFPPGTVEAKIDDRGRLVAVDADGNETILDTTYDTQGTQAPPVPYDGGFQDPSQLATTNVMDQLQDPAMIEALRASGWTDQQIADYQNIGTGGSPYMDSLADDSVSANRDLLTEGLQGVTTADEAWIVINSITGGDDWQGMDGFLDPSVQDLKFQYLDAFYDQSGVEFLAPIEGQSRVTMAIPETMNSNQWHDYADRIAEEYNLFPEGAWGANTRGLDDQGRLILDAENPDSSLFGKIMEIGIPLAISAGTGYGLTTALTAPGAILAGNTALATGVGAAGADLVTQGIAGEGFDPLQTLQAGITAPIVGGVSDYFNYGPGVQTGAITGVTQEAIDQAFEGDFDLADLGIAGAWGAGKAGALDVYEDTFQTGGSGIRLEQEMIVDPRYSGMVQYGPSGEIIGFDQEFIDVFNRRLTSTDIGKLVGPDSLFGGEYWSTEPVENIINILSKPIEWAAEGLDALGLLEPVSAAFDEFAAAFPNEEAKTFQEETDRIDAARAQAQSDFDNGVIGGNDYDDLMETLALDMNGAIGTYYESTIRYDERFLTNWEDERSEDSPLFGIWEDNPYIDGHTPPGSTGTSGTSGTSGTEGGLPSTGEPDGGGVLQTIVDAVWGDGDKSDGSTGEGGGLPGGGQPVTPNADVQAVLDSGSIADDYGAEITVPTDGRTDNQTTIPEGYVPNPFGDGYIPEGYIPNPDGDGYVPEATLPDGTLPDGSIPEVVPEVVIPETEIPETVIPETEIIPETDLNETDIPEIPPPEGFIPEDELPDTTGWWNQFMAMMGGAQGGAMAPVHVGTSPLATIEMLLSPYADKTVGKMGPGDADESAMIAMILNAYQNADETDTDKLDKILEEMQRVA